MKYTPCGNRIIVEVIKNDYTKTESGVFLDTESQKTESKNNLIKARIVTVGSNCAFFKPEYKGLVVLIHEVGGVPMHGIDPNFRVLREDDIWAFSTEQEDNGISLHEAFNSEEADKIRKGADS